MRIAKKNFLCGPLFISFKLCVIFTTAYLLHPQTPNRIHQSCFYNFITNSNKRY